MVVKDSMTSPLTIYSLTLWSKVRESICLATERKYHYWRRWPARATYNLLDHFMVQSDPINLSGNRGFPPAPTITGGAGQRKPVRTCNLLDHFLGKSDPINLFGGRGFLPALTVQLLAVLASQGESSPDSTQNLFPHFETQSDPINLSCN